MRGYTVATAAVTLQMPAKWLDNVLAQHRVVGATRRRQGVSRKLSPQAILAIEIALRLNRSLAVPIGKGLALAESVLSQSDPGRSHDVAQDVSVTLDIASITRELSLRLATAVEITPTPRRGRPRR